MKMLSIKSRVTLWYTALMTILAVLVFVLIFSISDMAIETSLKNNLKDLVAENADEIEYDDGELAIDENIKFYDNGIYILIYKKNGDFVNGHMPEGFITQTAFENEKLNIVENGNEQFYVYDQLLKFNDHPDIWVRGIAVSSGVGSTLGTMINIGLIALPFLVIFAAAGGYFITKRAFHPVTQIREAAETISEGRDLSKRINLSDGKDEIYALAETFDKMLDRLQSSFEAEKQFTADASHELRTPISVIVSQCEYALEHVCKDQKTKNSYEVILRQAQKISGLIAQLLMLTRADKGFEKLRLELFNLSELVEIVTDEQRTEAKKKQIEITTAVEPDIYVTADQALITRLMFNLLSNAIQYGKHGGLVNVELSKLPEQAVIRVIDNGIGIPQEYLQRIWDRFYQVETSRTDSSLGLGLSMVKWIAEAHSGNISVQSTSGVGSTFTFTLPLSNKLLIPDRL